MKKIPKRRAGFIDFQTMTVSGVCRMSIPTDQTLVLVMTQGIGANLTNDEKRAHLADLRRAPDR
jgi:hypothetical protein